MYYGADYYPEQWLEERWSLDADLMQEAGFNVVRLAEFAWSKMEPREGYYEFSWLDKAIDILGERSMKIVLGTPTASPPPWLMSAHPDTFRVRADGVRVTFGNRREYCPTNKTYRHYSARITHAMAEHFKDNPNVIGWQIDNEFGCHDSAACFCPQCQEAFKGWLKERYITLERLNERWGTTFWSHVYNDWSEISLPWTTSGSPNPGLALDYRRFASDSYLAYQQLQVDILRQLCPHHFLTHNFMGFTYDGLNYHALAEPLDFVSWDNYPLMMNADPARIAIAHDTMRGLKRSGFWVMEEQSGPHGWENVGPTPRPGEIRLWVYQAVAHGAEGILFFRWRTSRFGTEQYWHGILDHDGIPRRRYQEVKRVGEELKRIGEMIAGSRCRAEVAMLLSYDDHFAFQIQSNNSRFSYSDHFQLYYEALHRLNVPVDIVSPQGDLSHYKLVIAPTLHIVTEEIISNLQRYVKQGGLLVITFRSGVKDEANAVVNRALPGLLADLSAIEVVEYDSLPAEGRNGLEFVIPGLATMGQKISCEVWCDIIEPKGAEVVARYTEEYYAGKPAITLNRFGQGQVVYVGTMGDGRLYETLAGWLLTLAGVQTILTAPKGLEMTERWQGNRRLFVLNHTEREQEVTLEGRYIDLLYGSAVVEGRLFIAPRDVLVLREEKKG